MYSQTKNIAKQTNNSLHSNTYLNYSQNCFNEGKYNFALLAAEKAHELNPKNTDIILQIAKIFILQEQYACAEKYLKQIENSDINNSIKNFYLKTCYLHLVENHSSLTENNTLDNSYDANLYLNYSEECYQKREFLLALLAAEKAQKLYPSNKMITKQIKKIQVMQEKYEEALPYQYQ
ncbi:MAG: hypothetical protein LEGION0398_MBIBDBAK_00616 [Legionellaceae bacterium]